MQKVISSVVALSRAATGIAFCVLMLAVLIQVLGRSVFNSSPVWTEELTRFGLLFLAGFGAGLSFRSGDLVNVDIISESLPGKWPRRLRFIGAAATAILCAALILPAWKYTSIGAMQTSPALGWRMDFVHVSVLVMIVSIFIFAASRALAILIGLSEGLPLNRLQEAPAEPSGGSAR